MKKVPTLVGKKQPQPADVVKMEPASRSVRIVGLGTSVGGLEALVQFLGHVPQKCGIGFVVVQHMDPNHKRLLVESLQRHTSMPVVWIKDRIKIEADHVYVIPPNKDLSILHGVLHLLQPAAPRGLRLPIDFFFRSLAEDQNQDSVGVILSGMGSDGTLGMRTIKEKCGAVFVQTPASAKFDSMPRRVIDAGLADVIASAEELPAKIIDYLHKIGKIDDYVRYLRESPQETELLFKELLIGVTSFFRDPGVWKKLKNKIIPDFLKRHSQGGSLRAWIVGCSTGEEAYSFAIVFKEVLEKVKPAKTFSLQIFATDLDKDAIDIRCNAR